MAKNTVCELQVTINSAGAVAHVKIAKSSKIMAFDLAARAAIYRTKFPKDVWDKQIMIELGI
jgi:TonB family protein